MAVQTELVREFLVSRIHEGVIERHRKALPPAVEEALARVDRVRLPRGARPDPPVAAALARAGYLTRVLEVEMFEPAREAFDLRAAGVEASGACDELSAQLAASEPAERPSPSDPAATTWRIPGPGGHVRHYVALEAIAALGPHGPVSHSAKRWWLYGFFLRCCEEARAGAIRSED
jgi:hypothetical protein